MPGCAPSTSTPTGHRAARGASTTPRCSAPTWSGRSVSIRSPGVPTHRAIENRDYAGSNDFFFDLGHGNLLAFFDFPGLTAVRMPSPAACTTSRFRAAGEVGRAARQPGRRRRPHLEESGASLYLRDPDAPAWNGSPTPQARCTASPAVLFPSLPRPRRASLRPCASSLFCRAHRACRANRALFMP